MKKMIEWGLIFIGISLIIIPWIKHPYLTEMQMLQKYWINYLMALGAFAFSQLGKK